MSRTSILALFLVLSVVRPGTALLNAMAAGKPVAQGHVASEKTSRTPAQRKIDSQLLFEIYRLRGEAVEKSVPPAKTGTKIDERQRALVDLRADVTLQLRRQIKSLGGTIVSSSREYRSIIAWIPLLKLEQIAEDRGISAIGPADKAAPRR